MSRLTFSGNVTLGETSCGLLANQAKASTGGTGEGSLGAEEDSQFITVEVGNERSALFGE